MKKPRYSSFGAITLNKQDQLMIDEFDAYERENKAKIDDLIRRMGELAQQEGFPNVMICVADVPELKHADPDFPFSMAITSQVVQGDDYNVLVQMGTHLFSGLQRQLVSMLDAQTVGPDLSPYTTTNSFTGAAGQA